jgi:hypothetical protein
MRTFFTFLSFITCGSVWGHVPALLLPIHGSPISSYFIGQSDISRAIYSELTQARDYFVIQFAVNSLESNVIEIMTPVCQQIPSYEEYQPSVIILKGDLPWKNNGESNENYILRLQKNALGKVESNFPKGQRPQFYEEFGRQSYWVGGKLRLKLDAGLYALVVYNNGTSKGNFTLGINEREAWTPDLYRYVGEILPKISAGICDPRGFSGLILP